MEECKDERRLKWSHWGEVVEAQKKVEIPVLEAAPIMMRVESVKC